MLTLKKKKRKMDFLRECAKRLDAGEDGAAVLADVRARYATLNGVQQKLSVVRSLASVSSAFESEVRRRMPDAGEADVQRVLRGGRDARLKATDGEPPLPHRFPENFKAFSLTLAEQKQCKALAGQARMRKTCSRIGVDGRELLAYCRRIVDCAERAHPARLALAVMLLTGRRMVEVIGGGSELAAHDGDGDGDGDGCPRHLMLFRGQAKRRSAIDNGYVIPVLHDSAALVHALSAIAGHFPPAYEATDVKQVRNQKTSRKYQSWLSRNLHADETLRSVGRPHALRAVYACMCVSLFEFVGDPAPCFITMNVLGHACLEESLVYSTVNLGPGFESEPKLGTTPIELPRLANE